mmetsp:Transcript_58178/g.135499  ORF Transcript_58178/g.135499 Transcript_58178/m.135499 type:complete len:100 (+) Transcript_58178:520-819(+)
MKVSAAALAHVRLHTGRLHQIRAHFAHEGHTLVGDTLYGPISGDGFLLHSCRLALDAGEGGSLDVVCPVPQGFRTGLALWQAVDTLSRASLEGWLRGAC